MRPGNAVVRKDQSKMKNVTKLVADYNASLTKLTDAKLAAETRHALVAAALPDALSTDAPDKVRACYAETQRRGKQFIYDNAVIESVFGAGVGSQIRSVRHSHAA
jgi:hypothetical protein